MARPAFCDLDRVAYVAHEARRLSELRVVAQELRAQAWLRLGGHQRAGPELMAMFGEHPRREGVAGQLMRALSRGGRQGGAMQVYHQVRRTLSDELGVDPSAELTSAYASLPRPDPSTVDPSPSRDTLDWYVAAADAADRTLAGALLLCAQSRLRLRRGDRPGATESARRAVSLAVLSRDAPVEQKGRSQLERCRAA